MVNQAALKAAMDGSDECEMKHMDFARDKVLMGMYVVCFYIVYIFFFSNNVYFSDILHNISPNY